MTDGRTGDARYLSLSPLTVLPCSPLDQIDVAVETGFDAVGLRIFPVMDTDVDVMADFKLRRAIHDRIRSTGLGVFDVEVVRITPTTDVRSLLPAIEFAASVGARWLAVTSSLPEEYRAEDEDLLVQRLGKLTEMVADHSLGVMLEFMAYRGVATVGDAARVVQSVGHPQLKITIDALHFYRSGGTVADLARIPPSQLACVQLCDAPLATPESLPKEARYGRVFPGEGELPLRALLGALPAQLPACVEVPSESHGGMSVKERAAAAMRSSRALL